MKKYRVTKKHAYYKSGNEFIIESDETIKFIKSKWITTESSRRIDLWLRTGWIKEIQEFEFTKNDLKSFGNWCVNDYLRYKYIDSNKSLKKFKKHRENEK